jgi:hypothetical protein
MLLAVALAAGLLVAGCGDDDDAASAGQDSSGGTIESGTITKPAYIKEAKRICRGTVLRITSKVILPLRDLRELAEEGVSSPSEREDLEAELVETIGVPEMQAEVEQLEALGAPAGDEEEIEMILAAARELIEEFEEDPTTFTGTAKAYSKATGLAEQYGLTRCPYG